MSFDLVGFLYFNYQPRSLAASQPRRPFTHIRVALGLAKCFSWLCLNLIGYFDPLLYYCNVLRTHRKDSAPLRRVTIAIFGCNALYLIIIAIANLRVLHFTATLAIPPLWALATYLSRYYLALGTRRKSN